MWCILAQIPALRVRKSHGRQNGGRIGKAGGEPAGVTGHAGFAAALFFQKCWHELRAYGALGCVKLLAPWTAAFGLARVSMPGRSSRRRDCGNALPRQACAAAQ
jgi:hypothetical protein